MGGAGGPDWECGGRDAVLASGRVPLLCRQCRTLAGFRQQRNRSLARGFRARKALLKSSGTHLAVPPTTSFGRALPEIGLALGWGQEDGQHLLGVLKEPTGDDVMLRVGVGRAGDLGMEFQPIEAPHGWDVEGVLVEGRGGVTQKLDAQKVGFRIDAHRRPFAHTRTIGLPHSAVTLVRTSRCVVKVICLGTQLREGDTIT